MRREDNTMDIQLESQRRVMQSKRDMYRAAFRKMNTIKKRAGLCVCGGFSHKEDCPEHWSNQENPEEHIPF